MTMKFKLETSSNREIKDAISRRLKIADTYAGELSIEIIPLEKIELDPENNRELTLTLQDAINGIDPSDKEYEKKKSDLNSLESLAKTISENQLINPIYVYRYGNICRLIAGERRTLASAIAGKKEIIARIASERPVGKKLKILQWIENNERADLTLAERISCLESIIHEHFKEGENKNNKVRITAQKLSEMTGLSGTQSRRYILILNANKKIKNAITEGRLENIKLIELICTTSNEEHQIKILDLALAGSTLESLIKEKKELETNQKKQKISVTRIRKNISVGAIKPDVAKIIINALISSEVLDKAFIEQMKLHEAVKWNDSEMISQSLKKILSRLGEKTQ